MTSRQWMSRFGDWFVPITETGCWIWMRGTNGTARYGRVAFNGRSEYAHRVSYQLLRGPIPKGLSIDHLCRVRECVNPDHLEAVTPWTNSKRGARATKTHCIRGHEFTPENTRPHQTDGRRHAGRFCRACDRDRARETRRRRKPETA